ncbi:MAG: DUF2029 domain-containing protein [Bradyrhizobium sp.]|nr:DUF2029 domain-containing protein [Bradyrhizobium sp.]
MRGSVPPLFLLVAAPLSLLPYPVALAAWQGGTLALHLAVIAAIVRRMRQAQGAMTELCRLLPPFPPSSSISARVGTAFSQRRYWAARRSPCQGGRSPPAC